MKFTQRSAQSTMRKPLHRYLSILALSFILLLSCKSSSQELPTNTTWQGTLGGMKFILKLTRDSTTGKSTAEFDTPDQGASGIQSSEVNLTSDSLTVYSNTINAGFKGVFNENRTEISGTWKKGPTNTPLNLKRIANEVARNRPQNPQAPFPYLIQQGTYYNKDKSIQYGYTLTLPGVDKDYPAVILISGSGQQDRDETLFGHKPFWVIADHLTRNGIAVLRVDDRGIGKTSGDANNATSADFAQDVLAGIAYLKNQVGIDIKHIGLIGHSEGGVIAPLVANQSSDVAFIVSMAGVGIKGSDLFIKQSVDANRKLKMSEDGLNRVQDLSRQMTLLNEKYPDINDLKKGYRVFMKDWLTKQPDSFLKQIGLYGTSREQTIKTYATVVYRPWMRYFLKYDPSTTLPSLKIPVLAINGAKDTQVDAKDNLAGFQKHLTQGGHRSSKTQVFPGLNHFFQHAKTGDASEYIEIEETISPEVLDVITNWIKKL